MNNFDICFQYLMVDEGGYTNDPADSGGATNFGITIGDYRKYIKADATPSDVKSLTVAQAKSIYKSKYWNALGCDKLPSGVDNACFNYGVLAGLQRPRNDLKKFADIKDPDKLIDAICDEMKAFLNALADRRPKDNRFRKGWNLRVDRLRKNSHYLAAKSPSKVPEHTSAATGLMAYLGLVWNYIHSHPYLVTFGAIATVGVIWMLVNAIRNKNATVA
jgi:lysozyme family protein